MRCRNVLLVRRQVRHRLGWICSRSCPELWQRGGRRARMGLAERWDVVFVFGNVELLEDGTSSAGVWEGLVREREICVIVELFLDDCSAPRHGV